eukprot:3310013-Prymnesium_polylepis.1
MALSPPSPPPRSLHPYPSTSSSAVSSALAHLRFHRLSSTDTPPLLLKAVPMFRCGGRHDAIVDHGRVQQHGQQHGQQLTPEQMEPDPASIDVATGLVVTQTLSVLSFNVAKEKEQLEARMNALAALVADQKPDLVMLQELSDNKANKFAAAGSL